MVLTGSVPVNQARSWYLPVALYVRSPRCTRRDGRNFRQSVQAECAVHLGLARASEDDEAAAPAGSSGRQRQSGHSRTHPRGQGKARLAHAGTPIAPRGAARVPGSSARSLPPVRLSGCGAVRCGAVRCGAARCGPRRATVQTAKALHSGRPPCGRLGRCGRAACRLRCGRLGASPRVSECCEFHHAQGVTRRCVRLSPLQPWRPTTTCSRI